MKIFDCFMFYDEELLLDIRLNILDKYVDFFVIVESQFYHNGVKRQLKFDIKKFNKFKDKIIYIQHKNEPDQISKLNETDNESIKSYKLIHNAHLRENDQRNHILKGLKKAKDNGAITIGLLGNFGGKIKDIVDHAIIVHSTSTPKIQEVHRVISHIICKLVEEKYFERENE